MLELLQYSTWALHEDYLSRMSLVINHRLQNGQSFEGLIKKKTMEDYLPVLEALLNTDDGMPAVHADELQVKVERDQASGMPIVRANGKNIALIPLIGPLTKRGDLCSMGMQDYQNLLSRVNNTPSIDGVVFVSDSPGGTVDGTPELGLAIKMSMKPVGFFADNMLASAAVWLGSQSSVIVGNKNNPTQIGSIGVLMTLPNYQNVIDAGNLPKMTIYRASQSSEKALVNALEPITPKGEDQLQKELDETASTFISIVKSGRGDKLDTKAEGLFKGRMFDVYEAKKIGLIDAVGTLQTAINKVAELAKQKQHGSPAIKATAIDNMKFTTRLATLFGWSGKEATSEKSEGQESSALDQASIDAADQKLANMEAEIVQLKAEKEAATQKATQFEATVTGLNTQVSTLTDEKTKLTETVATQKAELAKKPTGHLTTVIAGKKEEEQVAEGNIKVDDSKKYETSIDVQARQIREQNEKLKTN